jgi:hypothetical protein
LIPLDGDRWLDAINHVVFESGGHMRRVRNGHGCRGFRRGRLPFVACDGGVHVYDTAAARWVPSGISGERLPVVVAADHRTVLFSNGCAGEDGLFCSMNVDGLSTRTLALALHREQVLALAGQQLFVRAGESSLIRVDLRDGRPRRVRVPPLGESQLDLAQLHVTDDGALVVPVVTVEDQNREPSPGPVELLVVPGEGSARLVVLPEGAVLAVFETSNWGVASDGGARVWTTDDGGARWTPVSVPSGWSAYARGLTRTRLRDSAPTIDFACSRGRCLLDGLLIGRAPLSDVPAIVAQGRETLPSPLDRLFCRRGDPGRDSEREGLSSGDVRARVSSERRVDRVQLDVRWAVATGQEARTSGTLVLPPVHDRRAPELQALELSWEIVAATESVLLLVERSRARNTLVVVRAGEGFEVLDRFGHVVAMPLPNGDLAFSNGRTLVVAPTDGPHRTVVETFGYAFGIALVEGEPALAINSSEQSLRSRVALLFGSGRRSAMDLDTRALGTRLCSDDVEPRAILRVMPDNNFVNLGELETEAVVPEIVIPERGDACVSALHVHEEGGVLRAEGGLLRGTIRRRDQPIECSPFRPRAVFRER